MSNAILKHRWTPWIPLSIAVLIMAGIIFYLGSMRGPTEAGENGKITAIAILVIMCSFFLIALILLGLRLKARLNENGFEKNLFFNSDFFPFYLVMAFFSYAYFEINGYRGAGLGSIALLLLFSICAITCLIPRFPTPLSLIFYVVDFFLGSPDVSRPDVLSERRNVQKVKSFLPLKEHSIFCGEIGSKKRRESLYISPEDRGVVIGPPGTGKTAFMVTQLLDLAERRGSFVCLDIKPELHTIMKDKLEAQGYRVLVFNPTNTVDRYNLLDDISGPTSVGELAHSLIPSNEGDNRAFDEGARDLLDGIVSYLQAMNKPVSLPAIRAFLAKFSSEQELITTLSQCPDPDVQDTAFAIARSAQNSRFMGSVFATLRANLRFLRYGDIRNSIEKSDFSLSVFSDSQPVALFLQFEERHQETTQLLLSAMISHLFNYFIEHVDRDPVLLMLDEIGNVPKIPGLVEKLNTIRSRKLPTWMYWQGVQQMQKYGKQANEGPSSIMAACDFHMAFRLNDNDSARWFSERIGTVDRVYTSTSSGGSEHSTTTSMKEEAILKVADLQSLNSGESVAIYRGSVWRNQATPYFVRWPEMSRDSISAENERELEYS